MMRLVSSDFNEQWGDLVRCPLDEGLLRLIPDARAFSDAVIPDGRLECTACGRSFFVSDGILRFIVDKLDHVNKEVESKARDEEAESYDQEASVRDAAEITPCLRAMQLVAGDTVLELGCGTGRFTVCYAQEVRQVVAVDFSLSSLIVLRRKLSTALRRKVLLVHADICAPPLARGSFSKVVSFQVLEHLPSPEMRESIFVTVSSLLKPGGSFIASVYNWSWQKQREAKRGAGDYTQKEGKHSSNIYYYNFEAVELHKLIRSAGMEVELMRGLIVGFRGARLMGRLAVPIGSLISLTPLGTKLAHLLLCRARLLRDDRRVERINRQS